MKISSLQYLIKTSLEMRQNPIDWIPTESTKNSKILKKDKIKKAILTEDNCALRFMTKRGCEESTFENF